MLPKVKRSKNTIYLDHAATTYLDKRVLLAMKPYWSERFGNPSALYSKGKEASQAVDQARNTIAKLIGAKPSEIIFTAGGTESVNLAIFGLVKKCLAANDRPLHLLSSAIEHHAVLNSLEALKRQGMEPNLISVDGQGMVNLAELKAAVRPETILVSIMYANNEVGSIQPIAEIGRWLRKLNQERQTQGLGRIYFHTDACQAAGSLSLDVNRLGVDLLSVNGSKIYGPKQTGFLYVRTGIDLEPIIYGGGQEKNLRSGTENVAGIVGLAQALSLAQKHRIKESKRLSRLRDYFIKQAVKTIPGATLNGPKVPEAGDKRLPNNINLSFRDIEGEALMLYLDSYNVCVATGSACTSKDPDPSHVLMAIGCSVPEALGSLRLTLGRQSTKQQLDYVLKILPGLVKELRRVNKA